MRKLTLFLIIFGLIIGYLAWVYTQFYAQIGQKHLPSPNTQSIYELGNPNHPKLVYVALGDSLTAGVGAQNYQNTYPYQLAEKLSRDHYVYLHNLGQPGAVVPDLLDYQLRKTISLKPQLVTIFIGTNDLQNFTDLKTYQLAYQTIISNLRAYTTAKIVLINIPYLGAKQSVLPPWSAILEWQTRRYNRVIDLLCQQNRLTCINLYDYAKPAFSDNNDLYASDHFHPSDAGYILWSGLINEHTYP